MREWARAGSKWLPPSSSTYVTKADRTAAHRADCSHAKETNKLHTVASKLQQPCHQSRPGKRTRWSNRQGRYASAQGRAQDALQLCTHGAHICIMLMMGCNERREIMQGHARALALASTSIRCGPSRACTQPFPHAGQGCALQQPLPTLPLLTSSHHPPHPWAPAHLADHVYKLVYKPPAHLADHVYKLVYKPPAHLADHVYKPLRRRCVALRQLRNLRTGPPQSTCRPAVPAVT